MCSPPWRRSMMHRLLGAASVLALLSGCGGAVDSTSSDTSSNALSSTESSTSSSSAPDAANVEACLADYANCVRAGSADETCHEGLRSCLPRPPGAPRGDGAGGGDCDRDRPPPPDGDGDAPPPPPPEGDADRPPPPPPPCIGELDGCARGSDAIETCVDAAVTCFGELPPPPNGPAPGAPPPPR